MSRLVVILGAALVWLVATPALPDQKDKRLDRLFERLAVIERADDALMIQARIWEIWKTSKDAETNRLMRLGIEAMRTFDLDGALKRFDAIVEHEPDFAEGWNKRATVYYLRGDYAASVADIKRTLALEGRHFGALSGLGMIYDRLEEKQGALKAYRKALEINPHLPNVRRRVRQLTKELEGERI
jgi:tetratricopeptide (TPR) repeat protein